MNASEDIAFFGVSLWLPANQCKNTICVNNCTMTSAVRDSNNLYTFRWQMRQLELKTRRSPDAMLKYPLETNRLHPNNVVLVLSHGVHN